MNKSSNQKLRRFDTPRYDLTYDLKDPQCQQMVTDILNIESEQRTLQDLLYLKNTIENIQHFDNENKSDLLRIKEKQVETLRNVKLETFNQNEWIYIKGYKSSKFYIVISGQVGFSEIDQPGLGENDQIYARTFSPSQFFGHYQLLYENANHFSSICMEKNTLLMTFERSDFVNIFGPYFVREFRIFQQLFEKHDFLANLRLHQVLQTISVLEVQYYNKNAAIYYENDEVNEIYLIQKGDIELYQEQTPNNQYSSKNGRKVSRCRIPISLLCEGEVLGVEDITFDKVPNKRQFMAIVESSSCKVLKLSKQQYKKCIQYSKKIAQNQILQDYQNKKLKMKKDSSSIRVKTESCAVKSQKSDIDIDIMDNLNVSSRPSFQTIKKVQNEKQGNIINGDKKQFMNNLMKMNDTKNRVLLRLKDQQKEQRFSIVQKQIEKDPENELIHPEILENSSSQYKQRLSFSVSCVTNAKANNFTNFDAKPRKSTGAAVTVRRSLLQSVMKEHNDEKKRSSFLNTDRSDLLSSRVSIAQSTAYSPIDKTPHNFFRTESNPCQLQRKSYDHNYLSTEQSPKIVLSSVQNEQKSLRKSLDIPLFSKKSNNNNSEDRSPKIFLHTECSEQPSMIQRKSADQSMMISNFPNISLNVNTNNTNLNNSYNNINIKNNSNNSNNKNDNNLSPFLALDKSFVLSHNTSVCHSPSQTCKSSGFSKTSQVFFNDTVQLDSFTDYYKKQTSHRSKTPKFIQNKNKSYYYMKQESQNEVQKQKNKCQQELSNSVESEYQMKQQSPQKSRNIHIHKTKFNRSQNTTPRNSYTQRLFNIRKLRQSNESRIAGGQPTTICIKSIIEKQSI